ncbi:PQQ-binding-like beta-propeller repeat protein [Plantactinospora sp. ZYX-F-223]|uniref:outer membrane protein assembly factor BamB family protein n=1 Tax=Plantactinospora sp. ZYX-F-223 TaxID=3144103 RepID=UPI0031FD9E92
MVIDLGTERYEPPAEVARAPREVTVRRWRIAAAAVAGILVLSTGGAGLPPAPPLRQVHAAPIGPADTYTLADGLLVTTSVIHEADPSTRRIVCHDLTDGRRLWSADFRVDQEGLGLRLSDGVLLVFERPAEGAPARTTALDPRTGERRWSVPYRSLLLPGGPIALVFDTIFRPESRIQPGQAGSTGEIYGGSDGHTYSEPPIGTIVRGLDLGTGRLRWELPRIDNARLVEAFDGRPTMLLTSSPDGHVDVRDVLSGRVAHRLDWAGGELVLAQRVGETVVALAQSGPALVVTAYSADLRQRRWSRSLSGPNQFVERCGPLLCHSANLHTIALDPTTGEARWEHPGPLRLLSFGPWLIEMAAAPALRRVLDARTGRTATELGGWRLTEDVVWSGAVPLGTDPPPLVLQPDLVRQQTWFGVLDPAGPSVRRLGILPYSVEGCMVAQRFMACRSGGAQLRVWRYEVAR